MKQITIQDASLIINYTELQKLRHLIPIYTQGQIELSGISAASHDTNYKYYIILTSFKTITKKPLAEIKQYIHGVLDCIRSY